MFNVNVKSPNIEYLPNYLTLNMKNTARIIKINPIK
jgi:hypothetical protein